MSKIVRAANAIALNSNKIDRVVRKRSEYFFLYDKKHTWSISLNEDIYSLFYYPGDESYDDTCNRTSWEEDDYMHYSTKGLNTREAYDTFRDLYQIVKEKVFGINKVLDDIIGGD